MQAALPDDIMIQSSAKEDAVDEMAIAEKLAKELDINDAGYVYFYLCELREEYRGKYPGYRILSLPGMQDIAVLPDGSTDIPYNVFKDDYPACREVILMGGGCC